MKRGRRKKNVKFKPDRAFLNKAIAEYIKEGGRITRVEVDWNGFDPSIHGDLSDVDDHLMEA